MAKLRYDKENELHLQVNFDRKIHDDELQKHKTLLEMAGFFLGLKWFEIVQTQIKIGKTTGTIVFNKKMKNKTTPGSNIIRYSLYSGKSHSGWGTLRNDKIIKILGDEAIIEGQSDKHCLMCIGFLETEKIEVK